MAERAVEAIKHVQARKFVGLAVAIGLAVGPHASWALAESATAPGLAAGHAAGRHEYTNRLIRSNDPYLLLHAHNPVDWFPWGAEAFAKAREENKPIFISIGYSTCYWCHVAERTIYSNPEIAKLMNQWFVNVKVDSEQRPDVDRLYMLARQIMTGSGGWPNNLFVTPDLKPFYAGSYFPPKDDPRAGPGFPTVLAALNRTWTSERGEVLSVAENVMTAMRRVQSAMTGDRSAPVEPGAWLAKARDRLLPQLDAEHGGFADERSRTKFPGAPRLDLLLADYESNRNLATLSGVLNALDAIAFGGIHDHLAGGFHRYSTEPTWSVPHFEKMLYDNAQLLRLYSSAFQVTNKPFYREIAVETAQYLGKDMMSPGGGFYTARDAQLDGVEGAGYLWTRGEIASLLSEEESARFLGVYGLTPIPRPDVPDIVHPPNVNGEPPAVLRLRVPMGRTLEDAGLKEVTEIFARFAPDRAKLMAARETRPQPARDEKMVVALNGLAIAALAESGQAVGRPEFVTWAMVTAERLWSLAYDQEQGALRHEIFRGQAQTEGFLQDYASLGSSFMTLFDISRDKIWLSRAAQLADKMLDRFGRSDGRFSTSPHEKDLLIPLADEGDLEMPSGTSMAIDLLLRLHRASGTARYLDAATNAVRASSSQFQDRPEAWASAVTALARNSFKPARERVAAANTTVGPNAPGGLHVPVSADHVRVTASAMQAEEGEVVVATIMVDDKFHINANPASFDFLIPTALSFNGVEASTIEYPKPTRFTTEFAPEGLDVYEGSVAIIAKFPEGRLKEMKVIEGTVSVQACTDQVCLPPSTLPVSIGDIGR